MLWVGVGFCVTLHRPLAATVVTARRTSMAFTGTTTLPPEAGAGMTVCRCRRETAESLHRPGTGVAAQR